MDPWSLFFFLDFLGVFAGAVDGGLQTACDRNADYDAVGVVFLSLVSALGGGLTRDVLLAHGTPLALADPRYLILALAGGVLVLLFRPNPKGSVRKAILFVDAAALGFFAVAGSTRALNAGLSPLPALLLGAVTAAGGGAWRDVLTGRTPRVFLRGQLYVIVALSAAGAFLIAEAYGPGRAFASPIGVGTGFLLRLLTIRYDWRTSAVRTWSKLSPTKSRRVRGAPARRPD
jgi:uncharacterized membrane protein YeiH